MYRAWRRSLSQNFLCDRTLVRKLIRHSSIGKNDTLIEIGPGDGIITEELIRNAKMVIAVELDFHLVAYLKNKFSSSNNLKIYHLNFLHYRLPNFSYKVFANIPFSIEGKIIRKLVDAQNPPQDTYLVVRYDLAKRLGGFKRECLFSIAHKPWFRFEVSHVVKRDDFTPKTHVKTALFRIQKLARPFLPEEEKKDFEDFIAHGFLNGRKIKKNLKQLISHRRLQILSHIYKFDIESRPSHLTFNQWLALYKSH